MVQYAAVQWSTGAVHCAKRSLKSLPAATSIRYFTLPPFPAKTQILFDIFQIYNPIKIFLFCFVCNKSSVVIIFSHYVVSVSLFIVDIFLLLYMNIVFALCLEGRALLWELCIKISSLRRGVGGGERVLLSAKNCSLHWSLLHSRLFCSVLQLLQCYQFPLLKLN